MSSISKAEALERFPDGAVAKLGLVLKTKDDGTLKQICEGVVIPNLRMREDEEELFEMTSTYLFFFFF